MTPSLRRIDNSLSFLPLPAIPLSGSWTITEGFYVTRTTSVKGNNPFSGNNRFRGI